MDDDVFDDELDDDTTEHDDIDDLETLEVDTDPAPDVVKPRKARAREEDDADEAETSAAVKARERDALARQVEEFLARGGKVQAVDSHLQSKPLRKPEAKYGRRSI